jgi:hypothetical protein
VPFHELLPHAQQEMPRKLFMAPLQRHVCRLKKKLPPCWRITCEAGVGYRLQVIKRQEPSQLSRSEPGPGRSSSSLGADKGV